MPVITSRKLTAKKTKALETLPCIKYSYNDCKISPYPINFSTEPTTSSKT